MAFGTFDHFHAGHESYLKQAAALGDNLIVVVARTETVQNLKGRTPDMSEGQRVNAVKKSGYAKKVVLGNTGDKYKVLRRHKPSVIALGYDQFAFTYLLEKFLIDEGINTHIVRLSSYQPTIYKTSLIRAQQLAPTT